MKSVKWFSFFFIGPIVHGQVIMEEKNISLPGCGPDRVYCDFEMTDTGSTRPVVLKIIEGKCSQKDLKRISKLARLPAPSPRRAE